MILGAARTPFGRRRGALGSVSAVELGKAAARGGHRARGVSPERLRLRDLRLRSSRPAGAHPVPPGHAGVGVPEHVGSDTINKVCASGMRAVALGRPAHPRRRPPAGARRRHGVDVERAVPAHGARYGYRFGDAELSDAMLAGRPARPLERQADVRAGSAVAAELGLDREELDEWALRSHQRAVAAIDAGQMAEEIVPVEIAGRTGRRSSTSTRGRAATRRSSALAALRPLVQEHPTHTAGNSPGVNDGAAALVVASEEWAASTA